MTSSDPMATTALGASLPWFRRVRLLVWTCQLLLLVWASAGLGIRLSAAGLMALVAAGFALDLLARGWDRDTVSEGRVLALMVADTVLHTAVFALSGGAFNPFTALYLVNIVLAALVLSGGRQWIQLAVSLLGFGSLFLWERLLADAWRLPSHQEMMRLHLTGMWLAFLVSAGFIVSFVRRVQDALAAHQRALTEARRLAAVHEKLAALTTLAAGAAHELATPLGTIAVTSTELARTLERTGAAAGVLEDVRLVREQVDRCRAILQGMSANAGELEGEALTTFPLGELLTEVRASVDAAARVSWPSPGPSPMLTGPRTALARALRNLIKNALEASDGQVQLELDTTGRQVVLRVRDHGPGLPAPVAARLGEPFFTTKPVGRGMGLGVFLTRTLALQLGGSLTFESSPGQGTVAALSLPLAPGEAR